MLQGSGMTKNTIEEFKKVKNELQLKNFLKYYKRELFQDIFPKEGKNKNDNTREYTYHLLEKYLSDKLNINLYYLETKTIILIIFYEYIISLLENTKVNENNRIRETKDAYLLFKRLISNNKFNVKNNQNIMENFNLTLTQKDFDIYRSFRDLLSKLLAEEVLFPFIDEYENFL
jgi:hypothetical protein